MKIYEFITPSDPITFKAKNDKVAFSVAVLLGNGKAGCTKYDEKGDEISLNTMLFLCEKVENIIKNNLDGDTIDEFIEKNKEDVAIAFESFSYGSVNDRKQYDDAINAITDPDKLKEFKRKHEDRNRTSISGWVKYAWDIGENIRKIMEVKL